MRLKITLNMPSKSDNPVHQILCSHPCNSIEEFLEELVDNGFVVVTEYYLDGPRSRTEPTMGKSRGPLGITYEVGLKVKELEDNVVFVD